jgi:isochorismate synthase
MKIDANIATLFVGGGITVDSEPESEWEETQHKLQTMLQVIYPML